MSEIRHRGARFIGTYTNDTPLEVITDTSDPSQVQELVNEKLENDMSDIRDVLKQRDITVFDACLNEFRSGDQRFKKTAKQWINENGAELLKFLLKSNDSEEIRAYICTIATEMFRKEVNKLTKSTNLQQPASGIKFEDISTFSISDVTSEMRQLAPHLSALISNLTAKVDGNMSEDDLESDSEDNSEDELIDSSSAVSSESENDSESEDSDDLDTDIEHENVIDLIRKEAKQRCAAFRKTRREQRVAKRKDAAFANILASICYAKSQKCNKFQTHIGYYLRATKTSKSAVGVLHQSGATTSYNSIHRSMNSIAASVKESIITLLRDYPNSWIFLDNINFYARVRDETQHNQQALQNWVAGYIAINLLSKFQEQFTKEDVDRGRMKNIKISDFLISKEEAQFNTNMFKFEIQEVMTKHCAQYMSTRADGKSRTRFEHWPIYQIPRQKTKIYSLPVYKRDESKITEVGHLLRDVAQDVDISRESLGNKIVVYVGDFLTVRNIRYVFVLEMDL